MSFGRRRVFRIGVSGFVLASSACALAPQAGVLIGARAIQGVTAALIIAQTIGLLRSGFSGPELSKALGTIGPVMGLAGISGPLLGGTLGVAGFGSVFLHHPATIERAFWVAAAVLVVTVGTAHLMRSPRLPRRGRAMPEQASTAR